MGNIPTKSKYAGCDPARSRGFVGVGCQDGALYFVFSDGFEFLLGVARVPVWVCLRGWRGWDGLRR